MSPYNGVFRLPSDNAQDINLGKITFKATHNGKSETFTSGKIICKTGTSIYQKRHKSFEPFNLKWHYYYMCRTTNCPVVLTENGYISNSFDYGNIISDAKNTEKAKAITRGIVNYFNSIQ